jgi:hypothetical protein
MMTYRVNLFRGRPLIQTELHDDLLEAKEMALASIASGLADRADVVTSGGRILFQYPSKRPRA